MKIKFVSKEENIITNTLAKYIVYAFILIMYDGMCKDV